MRIMPGPGTSWVRLTESEAEYAWHALEPFVERAVERTGGEILAEDVHFGLAGGLMHAWVVYEDSKIWAVCITQVLQDLHFRICRIVVLSGEGMDHWKHFEPAIEAWARGMNCDYIDALTRPGMARAAKDLGYRHQYTVLRKPVDKELH